jgi:hypothetical protein
MNDDIEAILKPIVFKEATEADVDSCLEQLGITLKRRLKTSRALAVAQAAEAKAMHELNYAKDDLRALSTSLLAV